MAGPRYALMVNALPRARESRVKAVALRRALERQGARVVVPRAAGPAELVSITRALVRGPSVDAVIACGGDGMVHLAVQALAGTDIPLGVLPCGTGCDFARAMGLLGCADPETAALVFMRARQVSLDLGRCEHGYFATILNCGFDARVTDRAGHIRLPLGRLKYNAALVPELVDFRPTPLTIELDHRTVNLDALLVAVGNTSYYGGGMRMCPGADPQDGVFDITVIEHAPRTEVVRALLSVYGGTHLTNPYVSSYRSRTVRITSPGGRAELITADGDVLGAVPVTCETVPNALSLLA